jgi:lipoprotein-anchoring transpeptidase ErfK/SrfK
MKRYFRQAAAITITTAALGVLAMAAQTPEEQIDTTLVTAPGATSEAGDAGLALRINLAERKLHVIEGGQVTRSYSVAIGAPKHPTPKGRFGIKHVIWNPRWVPPDAKWARNKTAKGPGEPGNPMGKVKMFFQEPDYYIHGTHDVDSLGSAESHGCVRMRNAEVVELAQLVMRHGGKPVEEGWVKRLVNRVRSTRSVYLTTSVPVTIS